MSPSWRRRTLGPLLPFLLLTVAAAAAVSEAQQTACGDGQSEAICRCSFNLNGQRRVDCARLDLLTVPPGIPDDTSVL